jgi:glycosyltransferase involved in cell wall biosynthesis
VNILVINHYAGIGEMEHRPSYLGREWLRSGHRVLIAAASFSHLRRRNPTVAGRMARERVDGIEYVWLKTPVYAGNGPRRALNILVFVVRLLSVMRTLVREFRPDVVVASSTYPLDILPAWLMAKRAGARLVFEVHDLWPLTPIELGGISPRHPFVLLMRAAERFAYRRAERVVSILPMAAGYMRTRGMAAEKFVYVPNGIDPVEWEHGDGVRLSPEHAKAFAELRDRGRFVVGYAGAHGLANALGTVLDAADLLRGEDATFVLVGQGPIKAELERAAAERGLDNVVFLPPVPKAAIPALLASPDALYIGLKRSDLFRFGVCPNKLIDYMMAGKPVIQAIEAGNDLVAEARCGISISPEDAAALADAVRRLMAADAVQRRAMGASGRSYVMEHHDYRRLAERFLAAVA